MQHNRDQVHPEAPSSSQPILQRLQRNFQTTPSQNEQLRSSEAVVMSSRQAAIPPLHGNLTSAMIGPYLSSLQATSAASYRQGSQVATAIISELFSNVPKSGSLGRQGTRQLATPHFQQQAGPQSLQHNQAFYAIRQSLTNDRQDPFHQMESALLAVPATEKGAYLMALQSAPQIVATESEPLRFLRRHAFEPQAAARSLVLYWERRVEDFGDRAFLPMMRMTGEGALSPQDIELTRCFSVLPNDRDGHSVVCFDSSKRKEGTSMQCLLRAIFWLGQVISMNGLSQSDGFISLTLMSNPKYDAEAVHIVDMVTATLPVKCKAFHVFDCRTVPIGPVLPSGFVKAMVDVFGYTFLQHQTFVHSSTDPNVVVQEMEHHGIARFGLPASITGSSYHSPSNNVAQHRKRTPQQNTDQNQNKKRKCLHPSVSSKPITKNPAINNVAAVTPGDHLHLTTAIDNLPVHQKLNYLEVLEKASPLVAQEGSNFDAFLRMENNNADRAAQRFVQSWQVRSDVFGSNKWKPLHQTGEGALKRNDISFLSRGAICLLPETASGASVLCIDAVRFTSVSQPERIGDRCLFYMLSVLVENTRSQQDGAILLYKIDPLSSSTKKNWLVNLLERLTNVLPLRFKTVHLISTQAVPSDTIPRFSFAAETRIHIGSSKQDVLHKLEPFDLKKEHLPKCIGGRWGFERVAEWMELRTRCEWRVSLGLSGRDVSRIEEFPAIKKYELDPEVSKVEHKRRLNVIHSRRKRDRVRVELAVAQEHHVELKDEQEKLQEENQRLEQLVHNAQMVAAMFDRNGNVGGHMHQSSLGSYTKLPPGEKTSRQTNRVFNNDSKLSSNSLTTSGPQYLTESKCSAHKKQRKV